MKYINNVILQTKPVPPKMVIYGTHGIGKSTFAADPTFSPVFIDIEGGLKNIKAPKLSKVENFDMFLEQVSELIKEEHEFKTVVIDSLDWLEKLIEESVCKEFGVSSILEVPFGKGYSKCRVVLSEVLKLLELLNQKNIMIILLAHAKIQTFAPPTSESYDRYSLKLNDKISDKIQEWCDLLGFVSYEVSVRKADSSRDVNRGIGQGKRVLYLTEKPAFNAKNRYFLPDKMEFSLSSLVTKIYDTERAKQQKEIAGLPDWF